MYDRFHYMVTVGGTAVSGLEIWQTGFRVAPSANHGVDELLLALNLISVEDIYNAFVPIFGNNSSFLAYPKTFKYTFAKVAVLDKDGHYAGAPKIHEGNTIGFNQVDTTAAPQLAWVATLGTGHRFGMAQKGRMYFPVPVSIPVTLLGATGAVPANHCDAFRDQVITALEVTEGEVDTQIVGAGIAVMSINGGRTAPQAPGTTNYVTEVSVGRILDTQRRRRGELQEVYNPKDAEAALARRARPAWRQAHGLDDD